MACCLITLNRCEPGTGAIITGVIDVTANTTSYYNPDGTAYVGDPALLIDCLVDPCCFISQLMCDANGAEVVVAINTDTSAVSYFDGNGQPVTPAQPLGSCFEETPLTLTTNGSAAGVTQSGPAAHVADITLISADTDNVAVPGTDGGVFVPASAPPEPLCDAINALSDRPALVDIASHVVVGSDGLCYADTTRCDVEGPLGLTGTQVGFGVESCTLEPMPAGGDPETGFPAAGFPEGWRQYFSGGLTGTEYWTVLNDTLGAPQWHQLA